MQSLLILYSALAVFGLGVTVVDFFGVLEQFSSGEGAIEDGDGGDGDDGAIEDGDGSEDAGSEDADSEDQMHEGQSALVHHGSYVASAEGSTRLVIKALGMFRNLVYFSLGSGLTGLFSLIMKLPFLESLLWSGGAGVFIAALAKLLRRFIRKDLDSSVKAEEFIMDEAEVLVSIGRGELGKISVRRYGIEREFYARARDASELIPKGSRVQIVDIDEECCWVDPL